MGRAEQFELQDLNPPDLEAGGDGGEEEGLAGEDLESDAATAVEAILGVILNLLFFGAGMFDWVSVSLHIQRCTRDPETDPLYWCLGLPCLLLPGFLLLVLMLFFYISKKAEFSGSNLARNCVLAALFDIFIFTSQFNYRILALYHRKIFFNNSGLPRVGNK